MSTFSAIEAYHQNQAMKLTVYQVRPNGDGERIVATSMVLLFRTFLGLSKSIVPFTEDALEHPTAQGRP